MPAEYQRRVLLYGILGAIVLRVSIILAGAWVVQELHWILYVFGGFLLITGSRMILISEKDSDLESSALLRFVSKHLRISKALHGDRFTVIQMG